MLLNGSDFEELSRTKTNMSKYNQMKALKFLLTSLTIFCKKPPKAAFFSEYPKIINI
jgi:hypothetical protein